MKHTKTAPAWAVELTKQVCKDYNRATPKMLRWYNGSNEFSSGFTYYDGSSVFVRAGTHGLDQELVLLHELAHHLVSKTGKGRKQGHSIKFWRLAFELYDKYKVDLDYAIYREEEYRAKANWAYRELMAKK